jgi:hypothetical protein
VVEGKAIIGMKKGVKYTLTATYNGIDFSGEVTINGDKATIVSSTGLNGSFPIDATTGKSMLLSFIHSIIVSKD